MKLADLMEKLEALAPARLAEPWDNVGLLVGDPLAEVSRCLVALDYSRGVFEEALRVGAQLILTHHPPIFDPIRSLRTDRPVERDLIDLVRSRVSLVSLHTNLDKAKGGLNDILADAFELVDLDVLVPEGLNSYKLVVYVPEDFLDRVQEALFEAGAGVIGNYRGCSYYSVGTGGFEPMAGARPAVRGEVVGTGSTRPLREKGKGKREGKREEVTEARLEVQVLKERLQAVLMAMRRAHPYEEVAYDLFEQKNLSTSEGLGRIGNLKEEMEGGELLALAGEQLASQPKFSGDLSMRIRKLAVCSGSGGDLVHRAVLMGADALITGDLKYHTAFDLPPDFLLIDAGHHETERYSLMMWAKQLTVKLAEKGVEVRYSEFEENPWQQTTPPVVAELALPFRKGKRKIAEKLPKKITIMCDGGARGNPGPAGIGAILFDDSGQRVDEICQYIGQATNNVAEYTALIKSLQKAKEIGAQGVNVITDSELMAKQMKGEYKVKNEGLKPLHSEALSLANGFDSFSITHREREELKLADELVNKSIDEAMKGS